MPKAKAKTKAKENAKAAVLDQILDPETVLENNQKDTKDLKNLKDLKDVQRARKERATEIATVAELRPRNPTPLVQKGNMQVLLARRMHKRKGLRFPTSKMEATQAQEEARNC